MRNEQCGICWNLKFDKLGRQTHGVLHYHDFSPFEFCLVCKEPKFDQEGFLTHRSVFDLNDSALDDFHEFVSEAYSKTTWRRKVALAMTGIVSVIAAANTGIMNLFY